MCLAAEALVKTMTSLAVEASEETMALLTLAAPVEATTLLSLFAFFLTGDPHPLILLPTHRNSLHHQAYHQTTPQHQTQNPL